MRPPSGRFSAFLNKQLDNQPIALDSQEDNLLADDEVGRRLNRALFGVICIVDEEVVG
ncbi:hypothetical protein [Microbacterium halotolerans]|uniref:hypothetical protein n=1 Tax=Microbacterium halotolerans TaxID=246613 RepID=UPI0013C34DB0|nr:hypothetical protein [Microbacterium halotolerans]